MSASSQNPRATGSATPYRPTWPGLTSRSLNGEFRSVARGVGNDFVHFSCEEFYHEAQLEVSLPCTHSAPPWFLPPSVIRPGRSSTAGGRTPGRPAWLVADRAKAA